eukprot:gene32065-45099_t
MSGGDGSKDWSRCYTFFATLLLCVVYQVTSFAGWLFDRHKDGIRRESFRTTSFRSVSGTRQGSFSVPSLRSPSA